jgi:hypothetical protein
MGKPKMPDLFEEWWRAGGKVAAQNAGVKDVARSAYYSAWCSRGAIEDARHSSRKTPRPWKGKTPPKDWL